MTDFGVIIAGYWSNLLLRTGICGSISVIIGGYWSNSLLRTGICGSVSVFKGEEDLLFDSCRTLVGTAIFSGWILVGYFSFLISIFHLYFSLIFRILVCLCN